MNCSRAPVCTTAGPPTTRTFCPLARACRIQSATARITHRLRLLARDGRAHEAEDRGRLARALDRDDAHAVAGQQRSARRRAPPSSGRHSGPTAPQRDPAVHLRVADRRPAPVDQDVGLEVGRRVEAARGRRRRPAPARRPRLASSIGAAPWALRLDHGRLEQLGGRGDDLDAGVARVGLVLADVELLDLVLDAEPHQLVHDPRQHQRVDDVAAQLDHPRVALVARSVHNPGGV